MKYDINVWQRGLRLIAQGIGTAIILEGKRIRRFYQFVALISVAISNARRSNAARRYISFSLEFALHIATTRPLLYESAHISGEYYAQYIDEILRTFGY